jgi:hypothetical protein
MPASDWSKIPPEEIASMVTLQAQWEKGVEEIHLKKKENPLSHLEERAEVQLAPIAMSY